MGMSLFEEHVRYSMLEMKRCVMRNELKENTAYLYRKKQILNAADDIAEKGNFLNVHNHNTLGKCKAKIIRAKLYHQHFDASAESVRHVECAEKGILTYKLVLRNKKLKKFKWPSCKRVCTDAVLQSFNNQTLLKHLIACATYLNNFKMNPRLNQDFVILQWCKCHYIHIICKDLD